MLRLLDTTLRDGSYIIDFQFTADDTAVITAALDANGVHYIEVGHGVGLGACRNARLASAVGDERYMKAAAGAVRNQRWGMFCIPGVATLEDLDIAAAHGMHFVRIGTNVTETEQATAFIRHAKTLGMEVFANFMKTYAASPAEVATRAQQVADDGATVVCVVDSAGGMLPEDVTAYVSAIRERVAVDVGYHGHNNLGLAVANTLVAVEQGATVIDTSLRGMGRSAGNASTEMTLFALLRRGIDLGIDPVAMLTIAEQRIDPLLARAAQERSIGVVTGFAQFHSSYLDIVESVASARNVDPRELIIGVTRENKIDAPRELVERIADELSTRARPRTRVSAIVPRDTMATDAPVAEQLRDLVTRLRTIARRNAATSVVNVVQSIRPGVTISFSSSMHVAADACVSTIEVGDADAAATVCGIADGLVDYILLDNDQKTSRSRAIIDAVAPQKSGLLCYSDLAAWTSSVLDIVAEVRGKSLCAAQVTIIGDCTPLPAAMASAARARGAAVTMMGSASQDAGGEIMLVCAPHNATLQPDNTTRRPAAILMDAWIGAVSAEEAQAFRDAGSLVLRPDMRPAIHAEIARALAVRQLVSETAGYRIFEGIPIAAGGVVAPRGTIVVDSVKQPAAVHGVADGAGALQRIADLDQTSSELLQQARTLVLHTVG